MAAAKVQIDERGGQWRHNNDCSPMSFSSTTVSSLSRGIARSQSDTRRRSDVAELL